MRRPGSVEALENLGRVRLSDFLHSEIANFYGIPSIPDDPRSCRRGGTRLCKELLEPLQAQFGRISIRSAFRTADVISMRVGRHNCASNEANFSRQISD